MIDIHSHVIFGVDDGPANLEESVGVLQAAGLAGVATIVATPHYSNELHDSGKVNENYEQLKYEAEKLGINLLQGYEIRVGTYMAQMPEEYTGRTLDNTNLLLLELPFNSIPKHIFETIYALQQNNLKPVLAHPERCEVLAGDLKLFGKIADTGCLMQLDAASIMGRYGRRAKRAAKKMLRAGQIHFVASDAHRPEGYSEWYVKAFAKVKRWVGRETAERLFDTNAGIILAGVVNEDSDNRFQGTAGSRADEAIECTQ